MAQVRIVVPVLFSMAAVGGVLFKVVNTLAVEVHPLAAVTVTEKVPAELTRMYELVDPVDHK